MKIIIFIFTLLTIFTLQIYSQKSSIESVYTVLDDQSCKSLVNNFESGILYVGECRGIGGYKLVLYESEHHQSLDLIAPEGKEFDLNLTISLAPTYLGKYVKWRFRKVGEREIPIAIIVRMNVFDDPDDSNKAKSYLLVVKITKKTACVVGKIPLVNKDQYEKTRIMADESVEKPCKDFS